MPTFIFIETKVINANNIAYVDLDPYGNESIGVTLFGNTSGIYDFVLSGTEADNFLKQLEACKVAG